MDEGNQAAMEDQSTTDYNINRKIFVGNISYRVRSRKLSKFFSKFGEVEYCYVVKDHLKKWSRGIAFVTFKTEESMRKALDAPEDELEFDGRQMRVKPAELSSKTKYWQEPGQMSSDDDEEGIDVDIQVDNDNQAKEKEWSITGDQETCLDNDADGMVCSFSTCSAVHINSLFDELLIKIFTLISVKERILVERVCTRWRHLAQRAWRGQRSLHFKNMFRGFGGLTDKKLDLVLSRCGKYLQCLDLSGSPRLLTDFAMDVIAKHCQDLQQLDISRVKATDVSLRNLVSRCSKLQNVRLKQSHHITDQGVTNLLGGSPDIERLDLTDLYTITGQCFQCAGENMKTVILNNCHKMRDSSLEILCKRCSRIEELHIDHCRELSSVAVRCFCQKLQHLKILYFRGLGTRVDSQALENLANLHNLESLELTQCHAVNDSVLIAISHGQNRLRHLNISSCNNVTDVGLSTLRRLRHLESIEVSYLNKVTGKVFITIAVEGRLRKVVARATKFLTDDVVISLATMSPHLHHLDLSGCFHITNNIFEGFKSDTIDDPHAIELYLGGTSVDWIGQDVDWLSGFSHLQVFLHNLALEDLRPDRELILPDYVEDSDEEEEHHLHHQPALFLPPEPFGGYTDDWDEDDEEGGNDGGDDYLDNDDPLAQERWDQS